MTLQPLSQRFSICKVADVSQVDLTKPFCFAGITDSECSLVCQTEHVPEQTTAREDGYRAFRVKGSMDLGLVGILSRITAVLAAKQIPVFAISTFDTDYVLIAEIHFANALAALADEGYTVED